MLTASGQEIQAAVRPLEPWRIDGKQGSIRSLQIQFRASFDHEKTQTVKVVFGRPSSLKHTSHFVAVSDTLIDPTGLKGPRVLALIPAKWLCDSWIVGPQVPAAESGPYSAYDRFVEKNFPGSLKYIDSETYHHWLFDRTTCWYKMYVRNGDRKYIEAAYQAAHFVRTHTKMDGPDAGMFIPKGKPDLKYVYPRAMHIHYLLTGDERMLETGKIMAKLILNRWDPVYHGGFWTPRHEAYGWLGVLHGWEMTGDRVYWNKARSYADALYQHQRQPPDGLAARRFVPGELGAIRPERGHLSRRHLRLDDGHARRPYLPVLDVDGRPTYPGHGAPMARFPRPQRPSAGRKKRLLRDQLFRRRARRITFHGRRRHDPSRYRDVLSVRNGRVLQPGSDSQGGLSEAFRNAIPGRSLIKI